MSEIGRCELALEEVFKPLKCLPAKCNTSVTIVSEQLLASRKMIRIFNDNFDEMIRLHDLEQEVCNLVSCFSHMFPPTVLILLLCCFNRPQLTSHAAWHTARCVRPC